MKNIVSGLSLLGLLAVSIQSFAAQSYNPVTITYYEVAGTASTPEVYLKFATKPNSGPGCATSDLVQVDPTLSAESQKAMAAIATSAYLAGKTVRVAWSTICTTGGIGRAIGFVVTSGT